MKHLSIAAGPTGFTGLVGQNALHDQGHDRIAHRTEVGFFKGRATSECHKCNTEDVGDQQQQYLGSETSNTKSMSLSNYYCQLCHSCVETRCNANNSTVTFVWVRRALNWIRDIKHCTLTQAFLNLPRCQCEKNRATCHHHSFYQNPWHS